MHVDRFFGELFCGPQGPEGARARAQADNPPRTLVQRRVMLLAKAIRHGASSAPDTDPDIVSCAVRLAGK